MLRVFEALEFQCIPAGIEEEHCCLLGGLAGVADAWLEDKGQTRRADPIRHLLEDLPFQEGAKVRHRDGNAIHLTGVLGRRGFAGIVSRDLIAEEIEVDPGLGTTAFGASQHLAIEAASGSEITHEEGEVEGLGHWRKHGARPCVPQLENHS